MLIDQVPEWDDPVQLLTRLAGALGHDFYVGKAGAAHALRRLSDYRLIMYHDSYSDGFKLYRRAGDIPLSLLELLDLIRRPPVDINTSPVAIRKKFLERMDEMRKSSGRG